MVLKQQIQRERQIGDQKGEELPNSRWKSGPKEKLKKKMEGGEEKAAIEKSTSEQDETADSW